MSASPAAPRRFIAAADLVLVSPALLFLAALVVRSLQPPRYEPAHSAQVVVLWYADRPWTLWIFLMALPAAVLVTGGLSLLRFWRDDDDLRTAVWETLHAIEEHLAPLVVAAATAAAAAVLVIVALHSMAD